MDHENIERISGGPNRYVSDIRQNCVRWASVEEDEDEDEEYWMDKCCDDLEMEDYSTVQVSNKSM